VWLVLSAVFVGSCDDVARHRVLDYFFDGVPPLGQDPFEAGPLDPNTQQFDQMGQVSAWHVHEPRKDCTNCHRKRRGGGFSAQTYLTAPVPMLCYGCHPNYTTTGPIVHGPVAVGQCLFCHNPHKSKIEHLLKKPEPDLCYLCHDQSMIELIPAHLPQQTSACTDCHEPHAGSTKALLKGPPDEIQDTQEPPVVEPSSEEPAAISEPDDPLGKRQRETAELYYRSMQLYREGEWARARDGFVKVLESGLIPAPMAETLRAYIADIDHRLARVQIHSKYKP
jgi:predicted CXXCH cytochrome family protein